MFQFICIYIYIFFARLDFLSPLVFFFFLFSESVTQERIIYILGGNKVFFNDVEFASSIVIYFWNYEELIKEGVNDGLIDPNYENMFNFERNLFKPVNIFGKNPLLFL